MSATYPAPFESLPDEVLHGNRLATEAPSAAPVGAQSTDAVTVVKTAEELRAAVLMRAPHIEIQVWPCSNSIEFTRSVMVHASHSMTALDVGSVRFATITPDSGGPLMHVFLCLDSTRAAVASRLPPPCTNLDSECALQPCTSSLVLIVTATDGC